MQTETQMAAALLISTAAMPPLTADHDGLTHNGRSARYGIKPACVNFRLAIQGNLSSLWHARCSVLHLGRRYAPLGHPGNAACLHGHARRAIDPERDITGYSALFQLRSVKHGGRRYVPADMAIDAEQQRWGGLHASPGGMASCLRR